MKNYKFENKLLDILNRKNEHLASVTHSSQYTSVVFYSSKISNFNYKITLNNTVIENIECRSFQMFPKVNIMSNISYLIFPPVNHFALSLLRFRKILHNLSRN